MESPSAADVLVVGGGVIGLSLAWRAAQRGLRVTVVDPEPGSGASRAAAGMLAPVTEAHYGEEPLLRLNLASAARWPAFAAELAEVSGVDPGYAETATLAVATDNDDWAVLDELHAFQVSLGLAVERLSGRECRRLEPMLAPGVRGGLLVAGDHQVDPRRLVGALLVALERAGVHLVHAAAAGALVRGDRLCGVHLDDGRELTGPTTVLAAGCWSGGLAGLPEAANPPVRPVKGQILRLRGPASYALLERTVRGLVAGSHVYLVPRADGEIVVGATMEEQGFDSAVTAGGVYELLRDAHTLVPGITELVLAETRAGLRPGSPDNAPIIGRSPLEGLVIATGHARNGILLAPTTADAVAGLLAGEEPAAEIRGFGPERFTVVAA